MRTPSKVGDDRDGFPDQSDKSHGSKFSELLGVLFTPILADFKVRASFHQSLHMESSLKDQGLYSLNLLYF